MEPFERLFGIPASAIRDTCVLMPFVRRSVLRRFGIEKLTRGRLYAAGNGDCCTVIHTRMGAVFTGDAVLYLEPAPCRYLFLFGTCGLLGNDRGLLDIGSMVSPSRCLPRDSFTELLAAEEGLLPETAPDPVLHRLLLRTGEGKIHDAAAISLGSLKLQEEYREKPRERGGMVVDLECAAFFAAARKIGRKAAALLVVSDIVGEKPFYRDLPREDEKNLQAALSGASRLICECINKNLND